jgi:soluble lytic murein transglycosylase
MKSLAAALLLALATVAQAAPTSSADGDDRFLAARDAVRAGDRARFERIAPELAGHDLEAYVDYWRLAVDLGNADPDTVRAFFARYKGSYVAEKLRGDWLRQLGKQQRWEEFAREYPALV